MPLGFKTWLGSIDLNTKDETTDDLGDSSDREEEDMFSKGIEEVEGREGKVYSYNGRGKEVLSRSKSKWTWLKCSLKKG